MFALFRIKQSSKQTEYDASIQTGTTFQDRLNRRSRGNKTKLSRINYCHKLSK